MLVETIHWISIAPETGLKCRYLALCLKLNSPLRCPGPDGCENYEAFLDGEFQADDANLEID